MTSTATKPLSLAALLALLLVASPAAAQVEVYDDGHVLVGDTDGHTSETALMVLNHDGANAKRYGLRAHAVDGTYNYGLKGEGFGGDIGRGLWGRAERGAVAVTGVFADADASGGQATDAVGLFARASHGAEKNYGVKAIAGGHGDVTSYGIHASAWSYNDPYPNNTRKPWAGYFGGDVHVTGALTQASDGKLKEDIEGLDGGAVLGRLLALKPKRYKYKRDQRGKKMGFSDRERFGFLAEEVEGVFPELVSEQTHVLPAGEPGEEGEVPELAEVEEVTYKALNYTDLIPLLVQALQAQQAEIEALRVALEGAGIAVEEAK